MSNLHIEKLLEALLKQVREHYRDRLVSLAIFGSCARGAMRPDSDLDFLIVADPLVDGRMKRVREFEEVEDLLEGELKELKQEGRYVSLSPVFKTPAEIEAGSPLFLDMTEHVQILFDRDCFFEGYLKGLRERMTALGSRKVQAKGGYYWFLKPDFRPGDIIEL